MAISVVVLVAVVLWGRKESCGGVVFFVFLMVVVGAVAVEGAVAVAVAVEGAVLLLLSDFGIVAIKVKLPLIKV